MPTAMLMDIELVERVGVPTPLTESEVLPIPQKDISLYALFTDMITAVVICEL